MVTRRVSERPTLQSLRRELHVSVSAVRMYLRCPEQYRFHYVVGQPEDTNQVPVALVFGGAVHHALACYYLGLKDHRRAPTLRKLTTEFREVLTAALQGPVDLGGSTAEEVANLGERMLAAFHAQAGTPKVLAVEQAFKADLIDPDSGEVFDEKLIGGFDAVVEGPDGRPIVLEHKTAARRWSEDQVRHDLQGATYAHAMEALGHELPITIRYQILTKTKEPVLQIAEAVKTECEVEDARRTIAGVLRAVDARIFYPLRGWQCDGCGWALTCRGGRPLDAPASVDLTTPPTTP